MTTNTLTIKYTDTTKTNLIIPYGGTNTDTSLVLHGSGSMDYGADLWANMLHLMEHFCNTTPPSNPVLGQLFYKSSNKTLQLYVGKDANGADAWVDLLTKGTTASGVDFSKYITTAGGTLTGDLLLTSEFTNSGTVKVGLNDLRAASKGYVDFQLSALAQPSAETIVNTIKTAEYLPFIYNATTASATQRTMGAALILPTEGYDTDGKIITATTTATALNAATRKYVDAMVKTIVPGVPNTITTTNLATTITGLSIKLPFVYNNVKTTEYTSRKADYTMSSPLILPPYTTGETAKAAEVNYAATRGYVDDLISTLDETIRGIIPSGSAAVTVVSGSKITTNTNIVRSAYMVTNNMVLATGTVFCSRYTKPAIYSTDQRIYYAATIPFADILPDDVAFTHQSYEVTVDFAALSLVPYEAQPYSSSFIVKKTTTGFVIYLLVAPNEAALASAVKPEAFSFTLSGVK
jgi:hypothetical protein